MILDVTVRQAATDVTTASRSLVIEVAGRMGLQGPPGADSTVPGPKGDPGDPGATGPQGPPGSVSSTTVDTITTLTQTEYDALGTYDPATLYFITGA